MLLAICLKDLYVALSDVESDLSPVTLYGAHALRHVDVSAHHTILLIHNRYSKLPPIAIAVKGHKRTVWSSHKDSVPHQRRQQLRDIGENRE